MENSKKEKRNKIVYWIFTIWFCFGMAAGGAMQLIKIPEEITMMTHLGYPEYFLPFLGIMKLLGVIVVLMPKFPVLKEWAYAGFIFTMLGALYSHLAVGDAFKETFPPVFLLVLTFISWYFRPTSRRPFQPSTT